MDHANQPGDDSRVSLYTVCAVVTNAALALVGHLANSRGRQDLLWAITSALLTLGAWSSARLVLGVG